MDHLRQIFTSLGLSSVETFIASGNVIFESASRSVPALEIAIANRLHEALGYEVATFIRTNAELSEIARYEPFSAPELEATGATLYIGFIAQPLSLEAQHMVMSFQTPVDNFHVRRREIYWACRVRSSESIFSLAQLEKTLGIQATFRNSNTVKKITAKYATPEC